MEFRKELVDLMVSSLITNLELCACTHSMHVFKERSECGPVPCKSEVLDWDNPKFIIKSTSKNRYEVEEYY